ncbi:hypothetical protein C8F01DRAFT_1319473 [Mycena amicta]|nr:hypothetical protein C8F01DRAFT_1319473 [Mycena amicta]
MPPRKRRRAVVSDTTVVVTTNLPDELLEFIFDAVPREDLMSLQLCQSRFRALARPRLYTTLVVRVSDKPELNDEHGSDGSDSDDDYYWYRFRSRVVDYQYQSESDSEDSDYIHAERARKRITANEKKRLEFWTSSHIAPCVHTCSLIGTETMKERHILLIATFFKRLPRLVKLQRLTLTQTTYDIARFKIIQALPNLRHLECANFVPGDSPGSRTEWASVAPLHLETLKLHFSEDSYTAYALAQHIRHDTLRVLSVTGRADYVHEQIVSGDSFPQVDRLIVGAKKLYPSPSETRAFLSKFPQTKVLMYSASMTVYRTSESAVGQVALPALEEFAGDCRLLPLILPTPTLKTLVIDRCDSPSIISVFQKKDMSSIASLHLTLSSLVFPDLVSLSPCLPHLLVLRIEIRTGPLFLADTFFNQLSESSPFPPKIEKLGITVLQREVVNNGLEISHDFRALRVALCARQPLLQVVWFKNHLPSVYYFWRAVDLEDAATANPRGDINVTPVEYAMGRKSTADNWEKTYDDVDRLGALQVTTKELDEQLEELWN